MGCCIPTTRLQDDPAFANSRDGKDKAAPVSNSTRSTESDKLRGKIPSQIILMGDSVLDDFYWLKNKHLDVAQQCRNEFGSNTNVYNFAVDETQTHHVIHGIAPNLTYVSERKRLGMDPYPISDDGKVYPFQCLKNLLESKESTERSSKPLVVLSVGGNDARVHLHCLISGSGDDVIEALKSNEFFPNYKQIVDRLINEFKVNVILVFVYQIQSRGMLYSSKEKVEEFLKVMEWGYIEMCKVAKQHQLPMIDLSRTFDPSNEDHYGTTEIEPSNLSGQFIVDLLRVVMDRFDFEDEERESNVFYGFKGSVVVEDTDSSGYLKAMKQRNKELNLI